MNPELVSCERGGLGSEGRCDSANCFECSRGRMLLLNGVMLCFSTVFLSCIFASQRTGIVDRHE